MKSNNRDLGWILGIVASIIAIVVFLTGWESISEFINGLQNTSVSVQSTPSAVITDDDATFVSEAFPFDTGRNTRLILDDEFSLLDRRTWRINGQVAIQDGVMRVTGESTATVGSMGEGDAIMVTFRYTPETYFALWIWDPSIGPRPTNDFRLFALQRRRNEGTFWRIIQDTNIQDIPFRGMISDQWLVLGLRLAEGNIIESFVRDQDSGEVITVFSRQLAVDWQGRFWEFVVEGVESTIQIDRYQEVLISS